MWKAEKKIERSETALRNSAVRCSTRPPAVKAANLSIKKPFHFGVVSYEASKVLNSESLYETS
jgi:hypothetical protein